MTAPTQLKIEIPFHRAYLGEDEVRAVAEVVRSGWLTMGPKTLQFEKEFAAYIGVTHAIAVNSCTAALHLCLEAIGIGPGDEVLVPTNTFAATAEVVTYFNARPVLVDIDRRTLNLDVDAAASLVTRHTRAIIPVHVAGQPCDLQPISELAAQHELRVIEDAAHALPAAYRGCRIGSISELTAFSFYATKTLTTGEGGMITTNNSDLAARMRIMRLHGISRDAWKRYSAEGSWYYEVTEAGYKYNLTDLQAAIGLIQLQKCSEMHKLREQIARRYDNAFSAVPSLEIPSEAGGCESAWHLYVLRLRLDQLRLDRDRFIRELKEQGVSASVHFIPLHLHPYYQARCGYRAGQLPNSEGEYRRYLSLPIFPGMTVSEVDHVIDAVCEIAMRYAR